MDEETALRPVREDDLDVLESLTEDQGAAGEYGWFGWWDLGRFRRRWAENRMLGEDGGMLMVVAGDERLGFVSWWRRTSGPRSHCWNMGIALLPAARGRGHGTRAHLLTARYLFAHTTLHRVEACTDVANVAERKALEKAGFLREGVTRGAIWRDGEWRDDVVYGLLRTDPLP
ncbi:GNAT family N-acetyltransferase [Amycolatopsis minnesotensis]